MEAKIWAGRMGPIRAPGRRVGLTELLWCRARPKHIGFRGKVRLSVRSLRLFNDLIGNREQRRGDSQLEDFRSPQIDHQLELGRRLNWKVTWWRTPENAVDVPGRLSECRADIGPVR